MPPRESSTDRHPGQTTHPLLVEVLVGLQFVTVALDESRPVVCWCRKGVRSVKVEALDNYRPPDPDVAYAWGQLSQSCSNPTIRNWNGVLRVLRYVKGTRGLRLTFGRTDDGISPFLRGYSNADYAGDEADKHPPQHQWVGGRGRAAEKNGGGSWAEKRVYNRI